MLLLDGVRKSEFGFSSKQDVEQSETSAARHVRLRYPMEETRRLPKDTPRSLLAKELFHWRATRGEIEGTTPEIGS